MIIFKDLFFIQTVNFDKRIMIKYHIYILVKFCYYEKTRQNIYYVRIIKSFLIFSQYKFID
jgi:hypothetical protein